MPQNKNGNAVGKKEEASPLTTYWEGIGAGRFLIPECGKCGQRFLPPRLFCPSCGSDAIDWFESDGEGELYSFSIVEKAPNPHFVAPYVIALATLNDLSPGSRFYSRLVDADPMHVRIGQRISIEIRSLEGGGRAPVMVLKEAV